MDLLQRHSVRTGDVTAAKEVLKRDENIYKEIETAVLAKLEEDKGK